MRPHVLDGVRVLEIRAGIAGSYCAKLLSSLGADVVIAEPDGPDDARGLPPYAPDGASLSFSYLAAGKESVVADGAELDALVRSADVLVTRSATRAGPSYEHCHDLNRALVYVDITPFGSDGPYAALPDVELLVDALGGWLYGIGDPEREPVKPPGWQSAVLAGTLGAAAAMAMHLAARESGVGDRIDLSKQAAVAWFLMNPTTVHSYSGAVWRRDGGASPSNYPQGLMRCQDGPISVNVMYFAEWGRFCTLLDQPQWQDDPRLATPLLRLRNRDVIDAVLLPWLASRTVADAVREAQQHKLPFAAVNSPETLLTSDHLAARSFWVDVTQPGVGTVRHPGLPFHLAAGPTRPPRPAPPSGTSWRRPGSAGGTVELPLRGVRVVDLTMAWAGPLTTRVLAELGAEVLKIESAGHMDRWRGGTSPQRGVDRYPDGTPGLRPWNRNAFFNSQNANKRGMVLDLKAPRGKEIFLELVRRSTMVVENFGSGAMGRLGLDYNQLTAVRPDLVMLSMPAFGRTGPDRDYIAHGPTIEAAGGNVSLQGYAGEGPLPSGAFAWGDPVAGVSGAFAALAGLSYRALHGQGCHLDLSHIESAIPFNFPAMLDHAVNGTIPEPAGNADPLVHLQAVVACAGEDRWIAVAVTDEHATTNLCQVIGLDEPGPDGPSAHQVTAALSAWSRDRSVPEAVAALATVAGVSCVPVLDAAGLADDPGLGRRGFFRTIAHPEAGTHRYPGMPWHHEHRPWAVPTPAPCFGADTASVLADVLGMSDDDISSLLRDAVTATEPATQGD